jgi:hypothetical protein
MIMVWLYLELALSMPAVFRVCSIAANVGWLAGSELMKIDQANSSFNGCHGGPGMALDCRRIQRPLFSSLIYNV